MKLPEEALFDKDDDIVTVPIVALFSVEEEKVNGVALREEDSSKDDEVRDTLLVLLEGI